MTGEILRSGFASERLDRDPCHGEEWCWKAKALATGIVALPEGAAAAARSVV